MNWLKSQALKHARAFGLEIIPTWRLQNLNLAQNLNRVFTRFEIEGVIDVGGNTGQYRDFLRREVYYTGPILTFEPIQHLALALQNRARAEGDHCWFTEPYALGESDGELELNVTGDTTFSSFLAPKSGSSANAAAHEFGDQMKISSRQTTSVKRLDKVLPSLSIPFPTKNIFLKVDTQGFEMPVVRGVLDVVDRIAGIQVEVSAIPIYEGMSSMWTVIEELRSLGFQVSGLYPVSRDERLRVIEFDCVLVKG